MEFKNTIEALQLNADEITRLLSKIKNSDDLRRIDTDIILDKLKFMYDLMLDIQFSAETKRIVGSEKQQINEPIPVIEKTELQKDIKIIQTEEIQDVISEDTLLFEDERPIEEIEKRQPFKETKKTEEEKLKERKQAARAQIEQDLKKEKEVNQEPGNKKAVISDRFKAKPTLAEELGSKRKYDDLATQLKTQGSTSVNTTFGVAEKFEVIRELFGGDKDKFEHTLQVAGMAGSFVEAYNYLKENYNWDMDNPHVQRLLEQIRRKLIVQRKDE
jgi:hypothetical protein